MIVKEDRLRSLLGVARATLYLWRRRGLPAASDGGPGKSPTYDLEVVNAWLLKTGFGFRLKNGDSANLGALQAEINRQGGVQTSAPVPTFTARGGGYEPVSQRATAYVIGKAFETSWKAWAAMLVWRHGLEPGAALDVIEDGLLVLNTAVAKVLGFSEAEDFELLLPDELQVAMSPEQRPGVIERIAAIAAEGFEESEDEN